MLFWAFAIANAQKTFITVWDAETQKPIFDAHISAQWKEQNAIKTKYFITNNEGKAEVSGMGKCLVMVSCIGYKNKVDSIDFSKQMEIRLERSNQILNEVEVVSNFLPQNTEASIQKVSIIDRDRIEKQGAVNLRDLLSNDLGIRVTQDNILGSAMTMQGVGGENVKILIDGVPVIGRLNGNIDLSQINLNNIERIEVIQGPASVSYGTNALGGIINLITKKKQKKSIEIGLNSYIESVGQYNFDGKAGFQLGNHNISVGGGRYFFDGFSPRGIDTTRAKQWNPKRQYFTDLNYTYFFKQISLRYSGSYYNEVVQNKGIPMSPFFIYAFDEYYKTQRHTNTIFLSGFVKPKHHVDFTLNYSGFIREREKFYKDLVTLNQVLNETNTDKFDLIMSRGIYSYRLQSGKFVLQTGYDLNFETAKGPRIKNNYQEMGDVALFLSAEIIPHKTISIKPGLRYAYNTNYKAPIIPSLSLKIDPFKHFSLRASYSKGFRAPDLKELFFEFIDINHNVNGNPNLKAETSDNYTLNLSYKINKKDYAFVFEPSGFYNNIYNRITLVFLGQNLSGGAPIYRNENIGRFESVGGQMNLGFNYKIFQLQAGYAYIGVKSHNISSANGDNRFMFTPEYRLNLSYNVKKWDLSVSTFVKHTATQPFLYADAENNIRQGSIAPFTSFDVNITKMFFKKSLQIGLFGKNLLNITNVLQSGTPNSGAHQGNSGFSPVNWGRTFAISIRYNFTK